MVLLVLAMTASACGSSVVAVRVGDSTLDRDVALAVIKTEEVWPEAYSVVGPAGAVTALWKAVVAAGARPAGHGVWSTLRVEGGRPVFGTDMDEADESADDAEKEAN